MKQITIQQLHDLIMKFRDDRNWKRFHHPKDLAISIALEASELMELFQWQNQGTLGKAEEMEQDFKRIKEDEKKLQRIKEELADVLIYCFFLGGVLDLDLGDIIKMKLEMNEKKYPKDKILERERDN
jgi:NTP pyrophosphatase (non-canonical NTP hydrolase)